MVCATFCEGRTVVHRLDARVRVAAAVLPACLVAVAQRPEAVAGGLVLGMLLAAAARLDPAALLRRLRAVNGVMAALVVLLPLTLGGPALAHLGPLSVSAEGLRRALLVAGKANAVFLCVTALIGTMHLVTLGAALGRLGVPARLVHMLFFTVRYSDVLHHEYARLRRGMRVRCFRPRLSRHTYRTMGYLLGMLLVRSFDRAHRILDAMKCRGFTGEFHAVRRFALSRSDAVFAAAIAAATAALGWLEWS